MRYLMSGGLIVAALLAYAAGLGPYYFGQPVLGTLLLGVAVALESAFWWRQVNRRQAARARIR